MYTHPQKVNKTYFIDRKKNGTEEFSIGPEIATNVRIALEIPVVFVSFHLCPRDCVCLLMSRQISVDFAIYTQFLLDLWQCA